MRDDPFATSVSASLRSIESDDAGDRRHFFYDRRLNSIVVRLTEGDYYVTRRPYEVISTVLGSCIAVCMRDPITGYGGMNHFLLPVRRSKDDDLPGRMMRYGSYSIERLTNVLIARGACRDSIEVKVFGGANVLQIGSNLGHQNADFVEDYLKREKLRVVGSCLRGKFPRRLRYFPSTGRAQVCDMQQAKAADIARREERLLNRLRTVRVDGGVELFDPSAARRVGTETP